MKYPGGYQIIDLKGLELKGDAVTLTDPELVQKVKYAFGCKKPVYITNYTSLFTYPRGPLLMEYSGDGLVFTHAFIESGAIVAYVELIDTGDNEYTINLTKI